MYRRPSTRAEEQPARYLTATNRTSNFFWALNQDGSPEGVVTDWTVYPVAVDEAKLSLLDRLVPDPTAMAPGLRSRLLVTRAADDLSNDQLKNCN